MTEIAALWFIVVSINSVQLPRTYIRLGIFFMYVPCQYSVVQLLLIKLGDMGEP